MSPEFWLTAAAIGTLAGAGLAGSLAWLGLARGSRLWSVAVSALRVVAVAILASALAVELVGHTAEMSLTALQVTQAVALAALLLHLVLWGWFRFDGTGPVADILYLGIVAAGLGTTWPAGAALSCGQCTVPAQTQDILFLGGAGAATLMGASGLRFTIRSLEARRRRDHSLSVQPGQASFMRGATAVTVALLASGLLVGIWWTWRSQGRLVGDDLRWGWMAAAWLLALAGWLGWRLSHRSGLVATCLALLAALAADVGVLAAEALQYWLGF
jgi:hypothetical protein